MDAGQIKGLQLGARRKIRQRNGILRVPSESGSGVYYVTADGMFPCCSCPDFELNQPQPCKHLYAVWAVMKGEAPPEAPAVPQGEPVPEKVKRPTYKQDWPNYNAAQVHEKEKFQILLWELCKA